MHTVPIYIAQPVVIMPQHTVLAEPAVAEAVAVATRTLVAPALGATVRIRCSSLGAITRTQLCANWLCDPGCSAAPVTTRKVTDRGGGPLTGHPVSLTLSFKVTSVRESCEGRWRKLKLP